MDDSVENLCENLKSTELENEEVNIEVNLLEEVISRGKTCLLVKLLTNRYYNRKAFKATMRKV